jgi:multiple sugar transport system permease protein
MRRLRVLAGLGLRALALLLVAVWSLLPIVLVVESSFKTNLDIFAVPPRLAFAPTLAAYVRLWDQWGAFFHGLVNSLVITASATLLAVVASTLAGYGYSRYFGKGLAASAFSLIAIRLIPPIVITLPLFPAVNWLRLNDTHAVLIILYATFFVSLGTLIMRTFIDQVPRDLDEASVVDGATRLQIIRRIIVPLSAQGIFAVAVFVVVYAWNEYLFAFIFTALRARTAPVVVAEMMSATEQIDWGVLFAATTIQLLPAVTFVVLAQRYLVAGMTAGAIKG